MERLSEGAAEKGAVEIYKKCALCPRRCGVDRTVRAGYCGATDKIKVARAALHFWEEPCLSGTRGAGTVFFAGCQLGCIYCQNRAISHGEAGAVISRERLTDIFFELEAKGAHNIDLVTPDCYIPDVAGAIKTAKERGIGIPFVCNCSGYETAEAIDMLGDLIDVWMPDFKYSDEALAKKYSNAPDYPEVAAAAIDKMVALRPECRFDNDGMMTAGVLIRHLLLPGRLDGSREALRFLYRRYGDSVWYSIMSQYTPPEGMPLPLDRRVTAREYDALVDYACGLGIENAFIQEGGCAEESFIPQFDCEGVLPCGDPQINIENR